MPRSTARILLPQASVSGSDRSFPQRQSPDTHFPRFRRVGTHSLRPRSDARCNQHPFAQADFQPVPGIAVKTLTDAVYVPVRTNMLSLYMAGYTYPAQGHPGILPRVRGSGSLPVLHVRLIGGDLSVRLRDGRTPQVGRELCRNPSRNRKGQFSVLKSLP